MNDIVIQAKNITKEYNIGNIGYGTLQEDLQSWWARARGIPDPNSILNHRNSDLLSKRILALNNINLEVKRGERVGIIGGNGATSMF